MQRYVLVIMVLVLLVSHAGTVFSFSGPKSFVWQEIDTEILVLEDGRLLVTEMLTLRYQGGPFTYVSRILPSQHLDEITDITVQGESGLYRLVTDKSSEEPYTFSLYSSEGAQVVRWVYPDTYDAQRTFLLRYTVHGGIAIDGADAELWWPIVFPARYESVEQAAGHISLPSDLPAEQILAWTPDFPGHVERKAGAVTVSGRGIPPGEILAVVLRFPIGVVSSGMPAWQQRDQAQQRFDRQTRPLVDAGLGLMSVALFIGFVVGIRSWYLRYRDPRPTDPSSSPGLRGELPLSLPPGLAAKLLGRGPGLALSATLFDLAGRGFVYLREEPGGLSRKSSRVVAALSGKSPQELERLDQEAVDILFGEESEVDLKTRTSRIQGRLSDLDRTLAHEMVQRGYFDSEAMRQRNRGLANALIVLIVGMIVLVVGGILAPRISWMLPLIGLVLFLAGMAWLVVGTSLRGLTPAGARARVEWREFQDYLGGIRPGNIPLGKFERLLPYAAALVDVRRYTRAFGDSDEPLPTWFTPHPESLRRAKLENLSHIPRIREFGDDFAAMVAIIVTTSGAISSASAGGSTSGGAGGGSAG